VTGARRRQGLALGLLVLVGLLGSLAWQRNTAPVATEPVAAEASMKDAHERALREQFNNASGLLQARRYEDAANALQQVLALAPRLPEAHVNLGFALLGLGHASAARRSFEQAIDLRPEQANAYWGLATALEQRGDLELALGAMRTYLHLSNTDDPARRARARAALWEWEVRLGRHAASAPAVR
jgi:Tfp pilus assembly protein PilF